MQEILCPVCGAPMYADDGKKTIRCKLCGRAIFVRPGETPEDAVKAWGDICGYR